MVSVSGTRTKLFMRFQKHPHVVLRKSSFVQNGLKNAENIDLKKKKKRKNEIDGPASGLLHEKKRKKEIDGPASGLLQRKMT